LLYIESLSFLSYCPVFLVQIQSFHQAAGGGETAGKAGPKEAVKVPLAKPAFFLDVFGLSWLT
jgi:hypothetical protein